MTTQPPIKDGAYYHDQLQKKMKEMITEKKLIIIQYIDDRIEDHIKKSGNTDVWIEYERIRNITGYDFPNNVLHKMILEHYEIFTLGSYDYRGFNLVINPPKPIVIKKKEEPSETDEPETSRCCQLM